MPAKYILKELCRYNTGTYADVIYRNALLNPDKEAFVYGQQRTTFSDFNRKVNSVIHALNSFGLKKGDGIGILTWNCLEFTDVNGAAMKGGFILSPFNPRISAEELEYIINYSKVKALFVGKELIPVALELRTRLPEVKYYVSMEEKVPEMKYHNDLLKNFPNEEPDVVINENDPFIIFYTSGTTGIPRGAVYTHYKKLGEARTKIIQTGFRPNDRHIMILPLFHIGGWSYFWALFYVGAANVIVSQRSFNAENTLKLIQDEKATDCHIVPTQLVSFLSVQNIDKYDLSRLKRLWYAASPMPLELLKKGIEKFGYIFAQGYGQSESGPDISILTLESHNMIEKTPEGQKILASAGQPCPMVHVRIVDDDNQDVSPFAVGEIIMQSKSVMAGYWDMPEETAKAIVDDWLHTGDMGYYDEKGFIFIVDRKKDMIITGGENVYPRDVEEVLYRHPDVLECAVIGIPDDKWVERVHAVIVAKKDSKPSTDSIIDFCKKHIAGYKSPRSVEFVESLPKNPQGKILKKELREKYWQGKSRKI
jgi:long-chain acyl-CoA synthetase